MADTVKRQLFSPLTGAPMPEQCHNHGQMTIIEVQVIDPSPFQRRQHFEEDKLKGLAASIQQDELIEPIVVRPNRKRYQLIAGERRWHKHFPVILAIPVCR